MRVVNEDLQSQQELGSIDPLSRCYLCLCVAAVITVIALVIMLSSRPVMAEDEPWQAVMLRGDVIDRSDEALCARPRDVREGDDQQELEQRQAQRPECLLSH